MIDAPETRYAKTTDGNHIAYQVAGSGDIDLLFLPAAGSIRVAWEVPPVARVLGRLASFSRLICFDMRGSGNSDPLGSWERPSVEERANEMLTVLDAVGSKRTALVANNVTGLHAIYFAASQPNRTSALVLHGCYARFAQTPDYPFGVPEAVLDKAIAHVVPDGDFEGEYLGMKYMAPHALRDPEFVRMWGHPFQ